jgi:hypothetical protein
MKRGMKRKQLVVVTAQARKQASDNKVAQQQVKGWWGPGKGCWGAGIYRVRYRQRLLYTKTTQYVTLISDKT